MSLVTKFAVQMLSFMVLFAWRTESVNMVVQVTVVPEIQQSAPLCSVSSLNLLEPLLTTWVTNATLPYIPDFELQEMVLTYEAISRLRKRVLRVDFPHNKAATQRLASATKYSPGSCSHCTSSGCSTYCGSATCSRCASSRRRHLDVVEPTRHDPRRQLIDFTTLGTMVSGSVNTLAQTFLLSNSLLSCLGDASNLKTNVTFILNQTLVIG